MSRASQASIAPPAQWPLAIGSIVAKLRFWRDGQSWMLLIRAAGVNDVPLLLGFSRELAEFERQPGAVVIDEEMLTRDGFGVRPKFRSLIAEWNGQAIGYALFLAFIQVVKDLAFFWRTSSYRKRFVVA